MFPFLILFYVLGFSATVLNISLFRKRYYGPVLVGIVCAAIVVPYSSYARISYTDIYAFLLHPEHLTDVCLVQIIQSFLVFFLCAQVVRAHYAKQHSRGLHQLGLFPSLVMMLLNDFILVFLYYNFSETSYLTTALVFAAAVGLLLWAGSELLRLTVRDWDKRIEMRMIVALLQAIVAMFLPLLAGSDLAVHSISPVADWATTSVTLAALAAIAACGFLVRLFIPIERIPDPWRRFVTFCM